MERVCFRLQVKKELMPEYIRRHGEVWPDMLDALRATGWTNYSLYLDESDGTLIGYLETPDLNAAKEGMAKTDVNGRWQAEMAMFFVALDGKAPDQGFLQLEEVFHLD
jgi:L-rhamnose mutarotase